ncbi:MAG: AIR synthase-related protein, partial [Rubrobacter sp.]
VMEDVSLHATPAFKREGDMVVIIGEPYGLVSSLAGSEYLEIVHGKVAGLPSSPDLSGEKRYADLVRKLIRDGIVDTAHDISGGGHSVALAEMALAGGIGMDYEGEVNFEDLRRSGEDLDLFLFGEGGSSFLIAFPEDRWDEVQDALAGFAYDWLGHTGGDRLRVGDLIDLGLGDLKRTYERDLFGIPGEVVGGTEAVG